MSEAKRLPGSHRLYGVAWRNEDSCREVDEIGIVDYKNSEGTHRHGGFVMRLVIQAV